ncbi:MAG TPA: MBL fold metallo-hydrolase [Firmicutes bacterium]|nr:MBL fold metallo-hydrolase [Bacillota bacterium]
MQLTEKIYAYPWKGMGNNCNAYLYAGEKKILMDPGHIHNEYNEKCLEKLLAEMKADGFTPEKIDLIICTHGHPDHCEAAALLQDEYQIRVAMHREEETSMDIMAKFFEQMAGKSPERPRIDIYLQEGELELGTGGIKDKVVLYLTPGHSPGSLSIYFPDERALVTGDVVFSGSIGRTDFPGGDFLTLGKSVEELSHIEDLEWLLPGHMQIVQGEEAIRRNFTMIKRMFF